MNMIIFGKFIYSPTSTHDNTKMRHIFRFCGNFHSKNNIQKIRVENLSNKCDAIWGECK